MYTIGIDIGSVATKVAIFDGKDIIATDITPTGWSPKDSASLLINKVLESSKISKEEVKSITATGYGRVSLPFATKKVTEITSHAKGAHFIDSSIRTIIDIGGQDSKVIKIDNNGNVVDFLMNDKCAAGTGRFLQVMSQILETDISDLSTLASEAEPENINSMCTVFAESEVVSLIASGKSKESIAAGLLNSVAKKTYALVSKVKVEDKVFFSGGVSKNYLLRKFLSERLNIDINSSDKSQFLGAIGACIIGYEM
ncbi:CoA-substrate-specific enzyme activase, putative [Alkalithermobacter thermoalcaliphilus JW-YL-7 = DSM 7308]|uniref:CoA-substrate-specific enzyme activase n=1 Tax=Alkalithermobacter thermoalcaliphilus JW-YL-7 = DSM 7308 TaxID=1121328 RepID=A0A150FS44_CLOPD|nr:CoA-substrate-specific enzyme activase [[Clostridium] paradoxum JW-YL-7 = DSM 7308]SHK33603.1 CoA-substrate-specific enzyme activase, putative [[Clostridium] paradoxum JW-YL-7 = DSM 7308]